MIVYFADRKLKIKGWATTRLPKGLTIVEDVKTEDVDSGVAIFECKVSFDTETRAKAEACAEVGNYILRRHEGENEFYTIVESELDTKAQEIRVYAEDAGLDLLNEVVGAYSATTAQPITHYIEKFAYDSGFQIGVNEVSTLTRKLSWDGEATAAERIASVATQFDGAEISYSFDIKGLEITNKYINVYKERGKDVGVQLRLNKEIDRIVTTKTITNLATGLEVTGGTPEESETPITLKGYKYDDGDFYVSGTRLYSRKALQKWSRYQWDKEPNKTTEGGHIVRQYSYDTTSQKELCAHAVAELKSICDMEVNYEIDISKLNAKIGDRVSIVDEAGELYLSSRILLLETSAVDNTKKATLGEHLIKEGGISQKVTELASQFAAMAAERRKELEKIVQFENDIKAAQEAANEAKEQAQSAVLNADEAKIQADAAEKAAQAAAGAMEEAVNKAESALTKAEGVQSIADEAKTQALEASSTAAAAKQDAQQAASEIAGLSENLDTLSHTMSTDYARKTDLTEATANLQTQITQNAGQITSTAAMVSEINETVNDAAEQAQQAQQTAGDAVSRANAAQEEADAAKTAADNASTAAERAQAAADNAATAAQNAQTAVNDANKTLETAEAELESAKNNLAAVTSRVDATEEEIQAAKTAVNTAQAAADKAKTDAANAQAAADKAKTDAATAQQVADNAKTAANNAQAAADAAQEAADKAQADVDALAIRMTTAETKITQNAEKIALMATKTEVTQTLGGYYTKAETDAQIQLKADSITSTVSATYAKKTIEDTRNDNQTPLWYIQNYPRQTVEEFKLSSVIGLGGEGYCVVETVVPWSDSSGGYPKQRAINGGKEYWRYGVSDTAWGAWNDSLQTANDAQTDAGKAQTTASDAEARITSAESTIQQLANAISMLVVDDAGKTLMEQTSEGWSFNFGSVSNLADQLEELRARIKFGQASGQPYIELSAADNSFKVRITNSTIQFSEGSVAPTQISTQTVESEQIIAKDELQVGGVVWKKRSNGNVGLVWRGVE